LVLTLTCAAGATSTSFQEGVQAFQKKEFTVAIEHFNKEVQSSPNNAAAYFNLGLSYNSNKEYGKAIWAFERTLKLQPNDVEAIDNIEQNYEELDNSQTWNSDLSRSQRMLYSLSSNTWSYISIVFSILSALFIILFRKSTSLSKKRVLLISSVGTLSLMAFSIYTASEAHSNETSHVYGIVINDEVVTFKDENPNDYASTGIHLEIGTKVKEIKKYEGHKVEIETEDGSTHFISAADIEFI
jgi:tetratricopeptide (TPR) repeat protein